MDKSEIKRPAIQCGLGYPSDKVVAIVELCLASQREKIVADHAYLRSDEGKWLGDSILKGGE